MSLTAVHAHVDTHPPPPPPTHKHTQSTRLQTYSKECHVSWGVCKWTLGSLIRRRHQTCGGARLRGKPSGMMPNPHIGSAPPWLCAQAHVSRPPLLGCRVLAP